MIVELEATAIPVAEGKGRVITTGVIDEEEMGEYGRTIRRKSTARGSVENVLTVLKKHFGIDCANYDLHINFPGGIPLDGPSAGIALVTVIYSAITGTPVDNLTALTGEVSILGSVMPVGGIIPKLKAAKEAGAKRVVIPAENWQDGFGEETEIQIIPVRRIEEVIRLSLDREWVGEKDAEENKPQREQYIPTQKGKEDLIVAAGG
jgi:Lon-like ATP-dependent protease